MATDESRGDALLRAVALGVAVAAVLLCAAALLLHAALQADGVPVETPSAGDVVLGTLFPLAGLLVLWRQPRNASGWVLLSCAFVAVSTLAHVWMSASVEDPGRLPLAPVAVWLAAWTFWPYWAQPVLLPLLFPAGRLPSPAWRPFARVVAVLLGLLVLSAAFGPNDSVSDFGAANPLGLHMVPTPVGWAMAGVQLGSGLLLWLVCGPVALWGLVRRQRAATGPERAQLQWLMLGFIGLLGLSVGSIALPGTVSEVVFAAGFACVPAGLAVAVLRHGMLDVEVVVNRTIVYAGLTAASVLTYLGVVALAGRWMSGDGAAPLVAGLVVAGAAAARSKLQRLVDRRLFGARSDPYALVQSVGTSTASAGDPQTALPALVEAVRQALRVPFVQVLDEEGTSVAEVGEPAVGTHVVPMVDRGRSVGVLVVGRRTRRERLRPEELSALQLDSLAGRLHDEPELAARAERLRDRLQDTVGEVRRIVDGLRPAALDELGLPAALQALATAADDPVHVRVTADLPPGLPAGVEAATYRIAGEAVANALRHADARHAEVTARVVDDALHLVVTDDGAGFGAGVTAGVGLRSMHDRAAEVGGHLVVDSRPGSGTSVRAVLPLQRTP